MKNRTFIIAEMSANHNHDFNLAVKILEAMAASGADAVKIQTYTPDSLVMDVDNEYFGPIKKGLWKGVKRYDRRIDVGNQSPEDGRVDHYGGRCRRCRRECREPYVEPGYTGRDVHGLQYRPAGVGQESRGAEDTARSRRSRCGERPGERPPCRSRVAA